MNNERIEQLKSFADKFNSDIDKAFETFNQKVTIIHYNNSYLYLSRKMNH